MKQITIVSGKGGTGKTTLAAALAGIIKNKVIADCDVDAANLYIVFDPRIKEQHEFTSSRLAAIDKQKCTECGKCIEVCRFEAVSSDFVINPLSCEGCGVCFRICPAGAINFEEKISGNYFISETRFGPFVHARLGIAEENSGKLVSMVRNQARGIANKQNLDYVLIDGPPGIGCPVIASLTGADLAVIVTEPTLSGIHDLERTIQLTRGFKIKTVVLINKYDINLEGTRKIEDYCNKNSLKVIGKMIYDSEVNQAIAQKKTLLEYNPESGLSRGIINIWKRITNEI